MIEIYENTDGREETTNQQHPTKNVPTIQQQEIIKVFEAYVDNPDMLLGMSKDPRTPYQIIEKIALLPEHSEARNNAIGLIVNDEGNRYSEDIFDKLLLLWEKENKRRVAREYEEPNTIGYIIAHAPNTPIHICETLALYGIENNAQVESVRRLINNPDYTMSIENYQTILDRIYNPGVYGYHATTRVIALLNVLLLGRYTPLVILEKIVHHMMRKGNWTASLEKLLFIPNENISKDLLGRIARYILDKKNNEIISLKNRGSGSSGGYTGRPYKA